MRCPFPGMDPYIERPDIWPDFHDSLIAAIRGVVQPLLRPKYVALSQDRLYVVESERAIRPDVAVVATRPEPVLSSARTVSEAVVAEPTAVFEFSAEEVREPVIHILDPRDESRIVTAIEVLSPSNKTPGPGRDSYLTKRQEYWDAGTNLVEIDLLRAGKPTARIEQEKLETLRPWDYLVLVTRHRPYRQEVYVFRMSASIPCVPVPLAGGDPDVPLDLQSAFGRCWEEGPYPDLLRYTGDPPVRFSADELAWSRALLKQAGFNE